MMAKREPRTGRAADHVWPVRIYYEDTDAAGIVYYANYLKFAERARTELLRAVGLHHLGLRRDHKFAFVVRHCEIDYLATAWLDDELTVHTRVQQARCASLVIDQDIFRRDEIVARLKVTLACLGLSGKVVRMPATVRGLLAAVTAAGAALSP